MVNTDHAAQTRLSGIFMPFAKARRDEVIARKGRFVHYTSAENAMNIIRSRRMWMRNAKCMNDYMEVSHGHELLVQFFQDKDRKEHFFEALKPCGTEVAEKAIRLFDQWWQKLEFNTFICSISEHEPGENNHGRLSMWRAYGQPSARAAIVLNVPFEPDDATKGLKVTLSPVAYSEYADVEKELYAVINNIRANTDFLLSQGVQAIVNTVFAMLLVASVSLKHEGFKEEKEWRAIYLPDLNPSKLMSRSIETISGVPQTVYKIPLEDIPAEDVTGVSIPQLVERVIIGPSQYPFPMYQAFRTALEEAGVENADSRVIISGIPLRT